MTREEFERMALNTDVDNRPSVFRLHVYDYSDDCYIIIDENYTQWNEDYNVLSVNVLPLSTPIPEDTRQRLIAKYHWAAEGNQSK